MNIIDYCTQGGKNLITDYIDALPPDERLRIYDIRFIIREKDWRLFKSFRQGRYVENYGKSK